MKSFFDFTYEELLDLFKENDLAISGVSRLFNWHYKKGLPFPCEDSVSQKTLEFLKNRISFNLPTVLEVRCADDNTVKFLMEFEDGKRVETVLIPFHEKYTICLSSQVGCAMNCSFCFTATEGFFRHLKTEEIVGQFLKAKEWLKLHRPLDHKILNVVFMGQGEPLHNFDAVKKASLIFLSQHGISLAKEKITVSTAGYLPGLIRFKEEMPNINIALSLHSAISIKRDQLIPLNKKYPLSQILPIIEKIPEGKNRFVTHEYLLIEDFNDQEIDAIALGELLQGKNVYINLIPFNPFPTSHYKRPTDERIRDFKNILDRYKIPTTIRTTKGDTIMAACGQLKGEREI